MKIPMKTVSMIDHVRAGQAIRSLRVKKSIAQKDLAEAIGIAASQLSDMEQGRRDWTEERFNAAVKFINSK
jgi:transcriptional regulator with XRE-family HTH domain